MKLSSKFFCLAYLIVLFSTSIGGAFLVRGVEKGVWQEKYKQIQTATAYVADSWLAMADVSPGRITEQDASKMLRRICRTMDQTVLQVSMNVVDENSDTASPGTGSLNSYEKNGKTLLESNCVLKNDETLYRLSLLTDATELRVQCTEYRRLYVIIVLAISIVSGTCLYIVAKKITAPLNALATVSCEIAEGNYGKRIKIKTKDREIVHLTENFNLMADAIRCRMEENQQEIRRRDQFVANFTHELKTPMTAIIGYSQMLQTYSLSPKEQKEASKAISREASRLEKLSIQLLDLYVLRNEEVEMECVSLKELSWQLQTSLYHTAKKYKMKLFVEFCDGSVRANRALLLSLLYNLTDNAFKASSQDSSVILSAVHAEDRIRFCVKDHGRGIQNENLPHVTEPFYREDKARSRKLGGAGLGLSLCKEIATLHKTVLTLKSEPGRGTTVTFDLWEENV